MIYPYNQIPIDIHLCSYIHHLVKTHPPGDLPEPHALALARMAMPASVAAMTRILPFLRVRTTGLRRSLAVATMLPRSRAGSPPPEEAR